MFQPFPSAQAIPALSAPSINTGACDAAIALIAREKRIPVRLLTHRSRCRMGTARARQLAMYLSHVILGCTLREIGDAFGRDRTTVSYACAVIEDLRDDPRFDEDVSGLERQLEAQLDAGTLHAH